MVEGIYLIQYKRVAEGSYMPFGALDSNWDTPVNVSCLADSKMRSLQFTLKACCKSTPGVRFDEVV